MGFFDTLGNLGKSALNAAVEKGKEIQELKAEYSCYDDDELMRIWKNRSGTKSAVAGSVLQERYNSYSDGELKEIYRSCSDERRNLAANILRKRGYGH